MGRKFQDSWYTLIRWYIWKCSLMAISCLLSKTFKFWRLESLAFSSWGPSDGRSLNWCLAWNRRGRLNFLPGSIHRCNSVAIGGSSRHLLPRRLSRGDVIGHVLQCFSLKEWDTNSNQQFLPATFAKHPSSELMKVSLWYEWPSS